MKLPQVALSLKQPWAALVAHGLKSIEIRRWSTDRRGLIYLHAAKIADPRPEAWARLPKDIAAAAKLEGGIIGVVEITGCVAYSDVRSFKTDRLLHLNHPGWYQPPCLYGFLLARPCRVRFRPLAGNVRFFSV